MTGDAHADEAEVANQADGREEGAGESSLRLKGYGDKSVALHSLILAESGAMTGDGRQTGQKERIRQGEQERRPDNRQAMRRIGCESLVGWLPYKKVIAKRMSVK